MREEVNVSLLLRGELFCGAPPLAVPLDPEGGGEGTAPPSVSPPGKSHLAHRDGLGDPAGSCAMAVGVLCVRVRE